MQLYKVASANNWISDNSTEFFFASTLTRFLRQSGKDTCQGFLLRETCRKGFHLLKTFTSLDQFICRKRFFGQEQLCKMVEIGEKKIPAPRECPLSQSSRGAGIFLLLSVDSLTISRGKKRLAFMVQKMSPSANFFFAGYVPIFLSEI